MTDTRTARAGRYCAVAAILATSGAIALLVLLAEPQRWPSVGALLGALLWGLGGSVAVALIPAGHSDAARGGYNDAGDGNGNGNDAGSDPDTNLTNELRIGNLMHLGRVPDQYARMASAIAITHGPVALVVPAGRAAPVGLDPAVVVVESDPLDAADAMAEFLESCDAVLVGSARAFPTPGCADAARVLTQGASWVQGSAEPLNRDRFGPMGRESLNTRLRRQATDTGLWCWEPEATLVSASLLQTHPLVQGRPFGTWLRDRVGEGAQGAVVDATLTRLAAPVAAEGYWPGTTARQCAEAADLSDAAWANRSTPRARVVAAGLLLRALLGWSVLLWLGVLVLITDGSPVRHDGGALTTLVLVSAVLRWLAPRLATDTRLTPVADVVAGLYALPGSLAATVSALTRRVRPPRLANSTRPLVWLGLAGTAVAASVLLGADRGDVAARTAAGAAVALLVLTWVLSVRSIVERSWRRVGFRIPLDLPAIVEPTHGSDTSPESRLVDGGPGGFAVVEPAREHSQGDEVTVRVSNADIGEITLHGVVAAARDRGDGRRLIGVELRTAEPGAGAWARTLTEAASLAPERAAAAAVDEQAGRSRRDQRIDRLVMGGVLVVSIAVVVMLALLLIGVRPLVIRSGSMEPTYSPGDIVFVSTEAAGDIRPGQVVTRFDAPEATDSLTHRVRQVTRNGDVVRVETRGDANDTSEVWSVPATRQVAVVVASVPAIGLPLTAVRSSYGWAVVVATGVLGLIAVLFRPRRRSIDPDAASSGSLKRSSERPIRSLMSTSGEHDD